MKKRFTKVSTAIALVVIMIVNMTINISAANIVGIKVNGTIKYDEAFNCLDVLNRERTAVCLNALTMDSHLMDIAITRAYEACVLFSHDRPNGQSCTSLQNTNTYYGENLASGYNTGSQVMSGWMSSSGHKANILNANYRSVGIACVNGTWVQEFSGNSGNSAYKPSNRTEVRTVECNASAISIKPSYYYSGTQNVKEGDTIQLHAPLLYMNGEQCYNVDDSTFTVTSSDGSIASVSGMTLNVLKGGDFSVTFSVNGTNLSSSVRFRSEPAVKKVCFNNNGASIKLEYTSVYYEQNKKFTPKVIEVKLTDGTIVPASDYTVEYINNDCIGTATVGICCDTQRFDGFAVTTFEILPPKEISVEPTLTTYNNNTATVKLEYTSVVYTDSVKKYCPKVLEVRLSNGKVIPSTEYTVDYYNNDCVGTASVGILSSTSNYDGFAVTTFEILPPKENTVEPSIVTYNNNSVTVRLEYTSVHYDPNIKTYKPKVLEVRLKDGSVIPPSDYTVEYVDNDRVGTARVGIISDTDRYCGFAVATFTILPAEANSNASESNANTSNSYSETTALTYSYSDISYEYDPNPAVAVVDDVKADQNITLSAKSYTKTVGISSFSLGAKAKTKLSYNSSNTSVAAVSSTGKVTIKGAGKAVITITASESQSYKTAVQTVTVTVKPKRPVINSLSASGKNVTIRCTSNGSINGIQIGYRTTNGKEAFKTVTAASLKKLKLTLSGKGKYQIRVRTFKTSGGEKIFSDWSATKTVKVS